MRYPTISVYSFMSHASRSFPVFDHSGNRVEAKPFITITDPESGRQFQAALYALNIDELPLNGGVEPNTTLSYSFLETLGAPFKRGYVSHRNKGFIYDVIRDENTGKGQLVENWSVLFNNNAREPKSGKIGKVRHKIVLMVREKPVDGKITQSWALPMSDLSDEACKKLISLSDITDKNGHKILPYHVIARGGAPGSSSLFRITDGYYLGGNHLFRSSATQVNPDAVIKQTAVADVAAAPKKARKPRGKAKVAESVIAAIADEIQPPLQAGIPPLPPVRRGRKKAATPKITFEAIGTERPHVTKAKRPTKDGSVAAKGKRKGAKPSPA